jgi:putative FmdB family regulatory protein
MPVYEYVCSVCGHRTDILHGINESGPNFCPECGADGSMRKAFAPPAIVFKGSGWAKKDRSTSSRSSSAGKDRDAGDGSSKPAADEKTTTATTDSSAGSASSSRSSEGGGPTNPKGAAAD